MGDTEKQWRLIWAELIMKMDDSLLSRHYTKFYKGLTSTMPVCRIGFPTKLKDNFFAQESKQLQKVKKMEMGRKVSVVRNVGRDMKRGLKGLFGMQVGVMERKDFYYYVSDILNVLHISLQVCILKKLCDSTNSVFLLCYF
jgi:transposase